MNRFFVPLQFTLCFAIGAIFFSLVASAWTGPTATAPGNNTAAPINVGSVNQVKNGNIGVNGLAVFGNTLLQGSSYLNFGSTSGTSGYGIWDNGGTLNFKNSGGSWQTIQATVATLVGSGGLTTPYLPTYAGWASQGTGDGGAAIYNDNGSYKTLMIVGNNSAGGNREVKVWDDLTVNNKLSVGNGLTTYGSVGSNYGGTPEIYVNGDNHTGGGIGISDDGGFYDYNDGWITYNGSTGLKIGGNNGQSSTGGQLYATGGIKFGDGTVQTTAVTPNGAQYTTPSGVYTCPTGLVMTGIVMSSTPTQVCGGYSQVCPYRSGCSIQCTSYSTSYSSSMSGVTCQYLQ